MKSKTGWQAVPEDNLTHRFQGDAAVANDRLTVVFRTDSAGAEVYSNAAGGPVRRLMLAPLAASQRRRESSDVRRILPPRHPGLTTLRIAENNPGAVMLQASSKEAGGGNCSLAYRLTAGQMIVEIRPEAGMTALWVSGGIRHVVAADFFGDDMVFPSALPSYNVQPAKRKSGGDTVLPDDLPRRPVRLPVENLFLGLLDQGQAQVMCVWQPGGQRALAAFSGGRSQPAATAAECFIEAVKGKTMWVALLEGKDMWHEQAVSASDADYLKNLDWRPPFPAKWRADLLGPGGTATSSYLPDSPNAGQPAAPAGGEASQSLNPQIPKSPNPSEDRETRRQGDKENSAASPLATRHSPLTTNSPNPSVQLLIYAMDRNQATPLTTFCPIDVMRNTLGVGPCQYILQTEGLATDSNPTPDGVMTWLEKQFRQKKEKRAAGEIDEQLQQMVAHVGRAKQRIWEYGRLARRIDEWCRATAGDVHERAGHRGRPSAGRETGTDRGRLGCETGARRACRPRGRRAARPGGQARRPGRFPAAGRRSPPHRRRPGPNPGQLPHGGPLAEAIGPDGRRR